MSIYLTFYSLFFFFHDTAPTEIYTLSLHDALPIFLGAGITGIVSASILHDLGCRRIAVIDEFPNLGGNHIDRARSEEHTSELQSRPHLVCRLLLEKKKKQKNRLKNQLKTKYNQ